MQRQATLFAIPTQLTHEIDALCRQAQAPLTKEQYKVVYQLATSLFTRGVINQTTVTQIAETCQLIRE